MTEQEQANPTSLMTLDGFAKVLMPTENLNSAILTMDGTVDSITVVNLPPGWNIGLQDKEGQEVTQAEIHLHGKDYAFTKDAILALAHAVGLPPAYVTRTPGVLIQSHLNYWLTHAPDVSLKLLTKDDVVLAVTKDSIVPVSNIDLMEWAAKTFSGHFEDIRIDPKSHHDLYSTNIRMVLPNLSSYVVTSRKGKPEADEWIGGIQIHNSLVGKGAMSIQSYLHGGGADLGIVMHHATSRYNRKIMGQASDEVKAWVQTSTEEVLKSAEHEFDVLESVVPESIADSVAPVFADVVKKYRVPLKARNTTLDTLVESEDLTYYGLAHALSSTASSGSLPHHYVTALMEIAGAVASDASFRCESCKRVLD